MILVTGGTGLVGSHLLLKLVKSQEKVRAIHRKNSDLTAVKKVFTYEFSFEEATDLFNKIEWFEAPLEDIPALTEAFKDITIVYHCAALVSFNSAHTSKLRKTNIEGTANIVNLCITFKIKKLCYLSSIATLGLNLGEQYVTENFTWHPEKNHSDYAISKHGAEIEVWRASQEGVPVVILNPGIIIGPGFWNNGSGLIFKKIDKGLNYHFPKTTGFVGVNDVAEAAVQAMNSSKENEQFILVAENLKFSQVLEQIAINLEKKPPQKELKPWMVYTFWIFQTLAQPFGIKKELRKEDYKNLFENTYYSNQKIKKELLFDFTPINTVIARAANIYLEEKDT